MHKARNAYICLRYGIGKNFTKEPLSWLLKDESSLP